MNKQTDINIFDKDCNYCSKQWQEFTTLTEEERNNLDILTRLLKLKTKEFKVPKYKIREVQTGLIFKSVAQAARHFNVSGAAIHNGLKRNNGRHLLRQGILLERVF